jgi:hypothetical protein
MPPLTAAREQSCILRLPAHLRTDALNKISANMNAPGGSRRQNGRANQTAAQALRNHLGIYAIESNPTGPLAAQVGGATPASITIEGGTPASAVIDANELEAVTWAGAGTRSCTVQVGNELAGNAKLVIV